MRIWSLLLLSFLFLPAAQDPVIVNPKIASVDFENSRLRIVRMHFAPHETLAMHSHPAQLVVRLTPSVLEVQDANGASREVKGPAESVFWEAPTTHTVVNASNASVENIEIEFKQATEPSVPVPVPVPVPPRSSAKHSPNAVLSLFEEPHHKWKFQNQYVLVTEVTLAPGESTYFHKHAHDNISVQLSAGTIQIQLLGKNWQPPVELKPGMVRYIPGDEHPYTHRVKNVGKTTFRVIDIELLK
jgi:beta-alanine degradation protein BauB